MWWQPIGLLLLFLACLAIIISNVIWSQQFNSLQTATGSLLITQYNDSLKNTSDPRVLFRENLGTSLVDLQWQQTVQEFPTYYLVTFIFGGALQYDAVGNVQTSIIIANVLQDAFPYPSSPDPEMPPGISVAYVQGGTTSMGLVLFNANAQTGLYTDMLFIYIFGFESSAPPQGLAISPRIAATWVVQK